MKDRLSVWTAYYIELSPEEAVRELKTHGIFCAELSDEHGLALLERGNPEETGKAFRAFLQEENFTMTQGHLWLRVRLCTEEGAAEKLHEWLRLYEAIGIENAVLHCDAMQERDDLTMEEKYACNLAALRRVQELSAGMRIRICLENLLRICRDADGIVALVDQLDEERFGICLDTGHLNMCEQSQVEFIRKAGHRLHALHIADNEGERDQHMMPFGRGNIDFFSVVRALREVGYEGLFNLEIPGENHAPLPVRGYKLEYIRKSCDFLLENA